MKIYISALALAFSSTLLVAGNASAHSFGTDITINDQATNGPAGSNWYNRSLSLSNRAGEDQEVEPGMVTNQSWDMEGFFQNGNILSLVGGFDFKKGNGGFTSGDIFISTDADYGTPNGTTGLGNTSVVNNFGYEFVLQLILPVGASNSGSYNVVKLDNTATTKTAWYPQNQDNSPISSNPWKYESSGVKIGDGSFSYLNGLTNDYTGFTGGTHYALTGFDLSFLSMYIPGGDFYTHFTMGCGNDNLMGKGTAPVPEPATMLLFGTGLIGLAGIGCNRSRK